MIEKMKELLSENLAYLEHENVKPAKLKVIQKSRSTRGKIFFYFFLETRDEPIIIGKMERDNNMNPFIEKQFYKREEILQKLPTNLKCTIPKQILLDIDGHYILFEEYVAGKLMATEMSKFLLKSRIRRFLDVGLKWLIDFQKSTLQEYRKFGKKEYEYFVVRPVEYYKLNVYPRYSNSLVRFLEKILSDLKLYIGEAFPITCQHGDFCSVNIILTQFGVKIIDWDQCEVKALPFTDLFSFLISFRSLIKDFDIVSLRNRVLQTSTSGRENWLMMEITNHFQSYSNHFSIPREIASAFIPVALINRMNSEYLRYGYKYGNIESYNSFLINLSRSEICDNPLL